MRRSRSRKITQEEDDADIYPPIKDLFFRMADYPKPAGLFFAWLDWTRLGERRAWAMSLLWPYPSAPLQPCPLNWNLFSNGFRLMVCRRAEQEQQSFELASRQPSACRVKRERGRKNKLSITKTCLMLPFFLLLSIDDSLSVAGWSFLRNSQLPCRKSSIALKQQHISSCDESIFFSFCLLFSRSFFHYYREYGPRYQTDIRTSDFPPSLLRARAASISCLTTSKEKKTITTINTSRRIHPRCWCRRKPRDSREQEEKVDLSYEDSSVSSKNFTSIAPVVPDE